MKLHFEGMRMYDKPTIQNRTQKQRPPPPERKINGVEWGKLPTRRNPQTPIEWKFWKHLPMEQWEACALSLNINPHDMKHHPQAWMNKSGIGSSFTEASYPNEAIKLEFKQRLRLLNAYAFKPDFF